MGSVAAGGLIETYADVSENLDISEVLKKKNVFALTVNGDSMIDACIADGDMVLMEPINDSYSLRNGTIVSAMVPGLGTTLKYFFKRGGKIFLEAANSAYDPIELNLENVVFQGKLLAVWRKIWFLIDFFEIIFFIFDTHKSINYTSLFLKLSFGYMNNICFN